MPVVAALPSEPRFRDHVQRICSAAEEALRISRECGRPFDGIVLHSGSASTYHAQDREIDFRPVPHFMRFAPLTAPDTFIAYTPGRIPKLVRTVVEDFWYEPPTGTGGEVLDALEVVTVSSLRQAHVELGTVRGYAYIGNNAELAESFGIDAAAIEPTPLLHALDWARAEKTPYEVECIRAAAQRAGVGHAAARQLVEQGASERAIHRAYLEAADVLETELPYTNITAWDDHAAILHYQTKRGERPGPAHVFLIDAGATAWGYASDITRTYARAGAHPLFAELLRRMGELQRQLVDRVRPQVSFVALHEAAALGICAALRDLGVLRISAEDALERRVSHTFFPHGLGHQLGLQVHDVGGNLRGPRGPRQDPPSAYPHLRNLRELSAGQVVTIEPGVYFIPMLLRALRASPHAEVVDWDVVDVLIPCGGIRIEDDVHVTGDGPEDLSRPFVPGSL